ncbi:glycosyltransferase family 61 protein [Paenibacillus sp. UASWS1643]|uniref:glycosyltransferase family 61 protein n=1 Tax=Paenibacillus sp. UASWS1643 TaxID=2580422 RepID=UPI00123A03DD|nr:glycosyltransferase family 61 protein [Paenibacillus sp. UASWS1643]KAA8745700.1 glycosyltransferase family 61 protein [Paenibacillus sp. UASWS1643]
MNEICKNVKSIDANPNKFGFYRDIMEWMTSVSPGGEDKLDPFDFGGAAEFKLPKTLETEIHRYLMPYTLHPQGGYIAYISNGRVWGTSGAILASDGKLIFDLSPEYDARQNRMMILEEHPALHREISQEPRHIQGTAAVLTFCGSHNYFHWLYDVLPRLGMLRMLNIPFESLVMNPNPHGSFVKETLAMFGVSDSAVIRTRDDLEIQADQLIVPSLMMNSHYPPWATTILRTFMLPGRDTTLHSPVRIFISRSKASARRIANEDEVIRRLEAYGFIPVCLEDWTISQQVQLFASAKAIVSPHGAGLANLAFCTKGTRVIEIFHIRHVVPTYWMISNHNQLDYYMMYGQEDGTTQERFPGLEDFYVDLDRLEQTLRLAGLTEHS